MRDRRRGLRRTARKWNRSGLPFPLAFLCWQVGSIFVTFTFLLLFLLLFFFLRRGTHGCNRSSFDTSWRLIVARRSVDGFPLPIHPSGTRRRCGRGFNRSLSARNCTASF